MSYSQSKAFILVSIAVLAILVNGGCTSQIHEIEKVKSEQIISAREQAEDLKVALAGSTEKINRIFANLALLPDSTLAECGLYRIKNLTRLVGLRVITPLQLKTSLLGIS